MKPRKWKRRPKHSLMYPDLLPSRPTFGREKALDRIARNSTRIGMLTEMLRRSDDFLGFCMGIGYIAQNWAMIEQNFDMWISMIYHDLNGKTIVDKRLPLPFVQKVEYLRESFTKIPRLHQYAGAAISLVNRADALAKDRNDLVHGVISSMRPTNGKWPMHVFDYDRTDKTNQWHVIREVFFGPARLAELERQLVPLSREVGEFGHYLLDREIRQ